MPDLIAVSLTVVKPVFGRPKLSQRHALSAINAASGSPALTAPYLTWRNIIATFTGRLAVPLWEGRAKVWPPSEG